MPRLDIDCPLCGSRHTERSALAWSKGLSHTRSTTLGIGGLLALPFQALTGAAGPMMIALWPLFLLKSFLGFGLFAARSWGVSQSVYSAESAPPYRFPALKAALLAPFAALFLFLTLSLAAAVAIHLHLWANAIQAPGALEARLNPLLPFLGIGSIAICAGVVVLGVAYNRKVWPKREAVWQRSFLCKRCGASFVVPGYDPVGENAVRSDRAGRGGLLPLAGSPADREAARGKAKDDERLLRKRRRSRSNAASS